MDDVVLIHSLGNVAALCLLLIFRVASLRESDTAIVTVSPECLISKTIYSIGQLIYLGSILCCWQQSCQEPVRFVDCGTESME